MPDGRSELYAIWRACERLQLSPPDLEKSWTKNSSWMQALCIAYSQIREWEDAIIRSKGILGL